MAFQPSPVQVLWGMVGISCFALAAALVGEFVFHLPPCILCLAQRVPFAIAILVALAGLRWPKLQRPVFLLLAILFLGNVGIAGYQVGIEQAWWGLTATGDSQICTAPNTSAQNVQALYESMTGTAMGDCAHPALSFHGITFAVMNFFLGLFLSGVSVWQALRRG